VTNGVIFDIKEFSIHDGPGIRITVFMKGCPLACMWCHNPEGQSFELQRMVSPGATRMAGEIYTPEGLADFLNRRAGILALNEGGVTFSGGEPLAQARFIAEVIDRLEGLHFLLDTSGFGREEDLLLLLERVDLVYFDLKMIDPALHRRYTGQDNAIILHNLAVLSQSSVPLVIRVPLVPGVTDTDENLASIAEIARSLPRLVRVDLLPYNRAAGAKYEAAGKRFLPDYNEAQAVNARTMLFERVGVKVTVA
jgi:pyruvate formate lyase activating enzyme